jgi:hypothetical protein
LAKFCIAFLFNKYNFIFLVLLNITYYLLQNFGNKFYIDSTSLSVSHMSLQLKFYSVENSHKHRFLHPFFLPSSSVVRIKYHFTEPSSNDTRTNLEQSTYKIAQSFQLRLLRLFEQSSRVLVHRNDNRMLLEGICNRLRLAIPIVNML